MSWWPRAGRRSTSAAPRRGSSSSTCRRRERRRAREEGARVVLVTSESQKWRATPYAGIELCLLRQNEEKGGALLLKLAAGARFPLHDHPGGEEVYVVEGAVTIGGRKLAAGDYLGDEARGRHDSNARLYTPPVVSSPNRSESR